LTPVSARSQRDRYPANLRARLGDPGLEVGRIGPQRPVDLAREALELADAEQLSERLCEMSPPSIDPTLFVSA
jgi:hypothetical protein